MDHDWIDDVLSESTPTIIGSLDEARIVGFEIGKNGLRISESCDGYFGATLTSGQIDRLIQELKSMREKLG